MRGPLLPLLAGTPQSARKFVKQGLQGNAIQRVSARIRSGKSIHGVGPFVRSAEIPRA